MKEFVEKLNNKLDELITDTYYKSVKGSKIAGIKNNAYHALREFINQLAEEHKPVILEVLLEMLIEAKRNCGEDSDCSECPFSQIEDRCILAELQNKGGNNGWIPCEKDLPKISNSYLVTKMCENDGNPIYDTAHEVFWTSDGKWDCERDPDCEWKVTAWQNKIAPYQPEKTVKI